MKKLITQKEIKEAMQEKNKWVLGIGSDYQNKVNAVRKINYVLQDQQMDNDPGSIQKLINVVVDYIYQQQNIVDNGTIHIWMNQYGELTYTLNDHLYNDNEHTLIQSFIIANESKPCTKQMLLKQFSL